MERKPHRPIGYGAMKFFIIPKDMNVEMAPVVSLEKLSEVQEQYDWCILDLNYREDEDIESMIEDFYTLVSKVRKGGKILVPKRSYWHLPNDMETIEILCEAIDLTIEAPAVDCKDVLVITK